MTAATKRAAADTRVWQRMLSGRRLDLIDPSPLDIEIADIAHGLARVARWNGQTRGAHIFSVAQHTLLVEAVMRAQTPRIDTSLRLAALLHDAPEYVIGDMISPFKVVLGGDSGRLCGSRGKATVWPRSRPARQRARGLFDALERGQGREAVSGEIQRPAGLKASREPAFTASIAGLYSPKKGPP